MKKSLTLATCLAACAALGQVTLQFNSVANSLIVDSNGYVAQQAAFTNGANSFVGNGAGLYNVAMPDGFLYSTGTVYSQGYTLVNLCTNAFLGMQTGTVTSCIFVSATVATNMANGIIVFEKYAAAYSTSISATPIQIGSSQIISPEMANGTTGTLGFYQGNNGIVYWQISGLTTNYNYKIFWRAKTYQQAIP